MKTKLFTSLFITTVLIFYSCQKEPTASFTVSSTTLCVGETVTFTNTSTDANSYFWDFGDGETSISKNPTHIYDAVGTYTVTLTAYSKNINKSDEAHEALAVFEFVTLKDPRDGQVYKTVKIGKQWWMAENLKSTHYADGTAIPLVEGNYSWDNLNYTDKAYCYYDNSSSNGNTYGALYTWAAAMNGAASSDNNPSGVQGICPSGWHLPSDNEWKELEMHLGMSQSDADDTGYRGTNEGSKLAGNSSLWSDGALINDTEFGTSGFLALPGGYRGSGGTFYALGGYATFWSATERYSSTAWSRTLLYYLSGVYRSYYNKTYGRSVRCIKDN